MELIDAALFLNPSAVPVALPSRGDGLAHSAKQNDRQHFRHHYQQLQGKIVFVLVFVGDTTQRRTQRMFGQVGRLHDQPLCPRI